MTANTYKGPSHSNVTSELKYIEFVKYIGNVLKCNQKYFILMKCAYTYTKDMSKFSF